MAHALRYFCSWQSERYKHQMRLELWEKDYVGEATAMVLSGEPKLTMEEGDTICGTSLDFGLLSEANGQYLHLYTTDNHKYLIKILRDSAVMWEGYLLPEYYSEAYIAAPYTVSFTATDWLGMLKNVDFPAEDMRVPILQIIKTCLQYTELPLDFACQLDMRVEGINDTTNILGALYLNPITFTGYNCYEVLEKILASFNATLRQMGHRWLISSIDDELPLRLISWDSLSYTGDGQSNNGELIGTNFAGTFIDGSMTMAIEPAKKSVDLSQDIFYRESWLKDYDFHSADAWELHGNILKRLPGWLYTKNPDNGQLVKQTYVEYLRVRPLAIVADNNYISQVINVEGAPDNSEFTLGIKFLTPTLLNGDNTTVMYVKIINRSSTSLTQDVAYLSVNGWTNEDSEIELNGTSTEPEYLNSQAYYDKDGNLEWAYKKDNWPITKINFISIPYSGTLEIRIRLRDIAIYEKKLPINPHFSHYFGGVYLTKTNVTKNLTISSTLNPDAAETASSVNLMLCDSPEERNVELVLNYFSLSNGALTTGKKWYYNGQEYEDFLHAIAYSYSRCYANKRQKLSGALYTDKIYNLCSFTDKWSGKRHIIKSWVYSIISERLDSMEIIETPAKVIELTLSTPEAGSSNKQNQPSGGTSGGGSTSMAGSGRYVNLDTAQEVSGEKTWNDKATFKKDIVVKGDGIFGGEVSGIVGEGTPVGVTDYSALTGKPSINGKELASGDNTLEALGIQPKGDYTTASQLATTLADYATKVFVSNNYASKSAVNAIQALIPATATADNQLADKDFVNSSIATATAEFRGSFTSLDELKATSGNLNDYAFYLHTDDVGNSIVDRYKWTTAGWLYEYTLNNSSFTAEQWAALNSAITATLVQSYNSHLKDTTIHITATERTAWNAKWDYNEETIKGVKVNAAGSADKLTSDAGTSAIPIYFKNGKPARCIPSDLFSVFDNAYSSSTGEYSLGITIAGHTRMIVVAYSTLSEKANKLATARTLWGKPFDGSANVSGDLIDVGNITASGKATIQGDIISGGEVAAIVGEGTPAGVTDYSALTGKPSINGVTLVSGNNTLASLGIQAAGDYATNSGVTTLLANYADKTFVSNNYVGKTAFNNHTADTNIHITSAERTAWNAKWDYNEATIKAVKVTSASSADSVAWSGIKDKPTSLKNPFALTFGSKTYDGSAAATITASDLGALTAHQSIYALTLQVNSVSQGTYNPASAAKTINIAVPTKTSDITNDSGFITSASIPTALKNPYAVEIKANGVSLGTYDGSAAATFNLSAANVGAANKVHTHTASEISGLPTKLSSFTNDVGYVSVRHKNGYSYNNLYTLYQPRTSSIYRIDLTSEQVSIWAMLFIEVSLRQNYSHGYAGKILINAHHDTTNIFREFNATILGTLQNINIYGSDGRYIYINASMSYSTISIDRVLVGDTATTADLSNITIEQVNSLPDTYQTAAICNGLHTGNFTKSLVEGVLTGNITSHTHNYLPLSGGTITGLVTFANNEISLNGLSLYYNGEALRVRTQNGDSYFGMMNDFACHIYTDAPQFYMNKPLRVDNGYDVLHSGNYNSYAPTLTGTGASGTWGINISGNAASATNADTLDGYHHDNFVHTRSVIAGTDLNSYDLSNKFIHDYKWTNAPESVIGSVIDLTYSKDWRFQIFCRQSEYSNIYARSRHNGTTWTDWHKLAFTTDNVASATKLKTPRNIWGQSFDGTSDVNGDAHITGDLVVDGEVSALVA